MCISFNFVADILIVAHEHEQEHSDFAITFEIISRFWFIRDLIKTLRAYIKNCSQCLQIQIRRHRSWENLQLIHSFSISFHTITINFVLELSKTKKKIDCILSITDKFTKRIMLVSEKFTYKTEDWAIHLLKETQWKEIVWDSDSAMIETTVDKWKIIERRRKKT